MNTAARAIKRTEEKKPISQKLKRAERSYGFLKDFCRVGLSSPDGFTVTLENLSRRFAELREELLDQYKDDQGTLYVLLEELNHDFENVLHRATLFSIPQMPPSPIAVAGTAKAAAAESEWEDNETISSILQLLQANVIRYVDLFFDNFICNIQIQDFQAAYDNSMNGLWRSTAQPARTS